jgi:hypothetical protein
MLKTKLQIRKRSAVTAIILIGALGLCAVLYFHYFSTNAAYISSQYTKIQIPVSFKLKKSVVTNAVSDDPSLPAQGFYGYNLATGVNPQKALNSLRDELIREGYKTTKVNVYTVNGSLKYAFSAHNNKLSLECSILWDTPKTTATGPNDNELIVYAGRSSS